MSDYTDEQVRQFAKATRHSLWPDQLENLRLMLRDLDEAGITVQFPEPRYRAMKSAGTPWLVVDTHATDNPYDDPSTIATFFAPHGQSVGHPDPEGAAQAEADRLNREAS